MASNDVYLDYNATALVKPQVIEAMAEAMAAVGNPSSVHTSGRRAKKLIERARAQVAALVNAPPEAVIFTSGGTEANNQALTGGGPVLASAIEHESVRHVAESLPPAAVDGTGRIDLNALETALNTLAPATLSLMLANNETGVIQPVNEVVSLARDRDIQVHVDAVQAAGKVVIDFSELGANSISLSAHKFGGPQGVGALIVQPDFEPQAMLKGGAQERRLRPGTENVPGIVGFGEAASLALADRSFAQRVGRLRDRMEAEIGAITPAVRVIGTEAPRLPNTSCVTMPGVSHETQLIAFDLAGVAVSSGSACSSGKVGSSHVLAAMAVPPEEAVTAIRVSFGWNSQDTDVDRFVRTYANLFDRHHTRRQENHAAAAAGYG